MSELLELATRCKQATGPDRELDAAIWCFLNGREFPQPPYSQMLQYDRYDPSKGTFEQGTKSGIMLQSYKDNALHYTASLDAAMTLVPGGYSWRVGFSRAVNNDRAFAGALVIVDGKPISVGGATPALALCAAALRARASTETHKETNR